MAVLPSDTLFAYGSTWSQDDFSGRAVIGVEGAPAGVDLLIGGIAFTLAEHIQIDPHIGPSFGVAVFGKAPLIASVTGTLIDTPVTGGRAALTNLYTGELRLEAAARTGRLPTLCFLNVALYGPFLSLTLEESSASEDTLQVGMEMLVFKLQSFGHTAVTVDYAHGMEPRLPALDADGIAEGKAETEKSIDKIESEGDEVSLKKSRPKNAKAMS